MSTIHSMGALPMSLSTCLKNIQAALRDEVIRWDDPLAFRVAVAAN
jgi:hypothetical protein